MPASAASKVTKVKKVETYSNSQEKVTIKGYTSAGKLVWKYKCSTTPITQGSHVGYTTNSKYVIIFDKDTYIRLSKQTGKVLKKKKNRPVGATCSAIYADGSGNVYVMNYFNTVLYKISKYGNVIWQRDLGSNQYWAYKIKRSGSYIKVYFESEWASTKKVSMKTGKVL